jgi:hypothetical protein
VEYLPVAGAAENVGIVDLLVGPVTSTVWVKNFNAKPSQVTLRISDAEQQVLMGRGETKQITFNTPPGVAELEIKEKDGLLADNMAWTSAPEKNRIRMLIITNDKDEFDDSNFRVAMNVISKNFPTTFDIQYAMPPKVPQLDHDIYVVDAAELNKILPQYVKELKDQISKGASLIVVAQQDLFSLDWLGLLPVTYVKEFEGGRASLVPESLPALTEDIDFGQVSSYLRVAATPDATVVVKTEQDPVIALRREGKGFILYYGLDDTKSSFSKDPGYPVFWRRAFDVLTERPSLANLNVRTGTLLALPRAAAIKTPDGTVTVAMLPILRTGLYTLPDRTIAANILSPGESSLTVPGNVSKQRSQADGEQSEKVPQELLDYFLWGATALLILEILYIKFRGDC